MAERTMGTFGRNNTESTTDTETCKLQEREGGRAAWLTVAGSILVYYASFGVMNSFGFFQNYYSSDFLEETPPSTIAFIGTVQMALMNLLAALSGALCDRYGVKYLYVGSGAGTVLALIMLSFIHPGQLWLVLMTQGLLMGFTIAFGVQPAVTVVGQHFTERRALAMGLVSTGSALGGIGFPLMFDQLLPRLGFPNSLRLAAVKIAVCYFVALRISTSKPSGKPNRKGLNSLIDFKGFIDTRYAVLCIGTWLAILGLWIPAYYLKPYANSVYPGNKVSDYFLCMLNGSSIIGATLGGFIGDQIGRLNLLWPITLVSGCLCLFLWLLGNSMATLIFFVCVYGFLTSNVTALPPSIIGHITPNEKLGARIGAFYSVIAIASLVGTPIGGALITNHDTRDGYRWLIVFSGAALLIGSAFMFISRLLHDKALHTKW
ncbi:major facilitator superfamily domain-containing protein [Alternaria rosae]|uniref:major facilitator superfamily domain-containing protein n=1 Tax=Alternaria rosae TaxID=1187941 RepID=UPI001E8E72A9|nr:major facilitator superfamily domain-containing protein [Alternaria rosae]KAH6878099.1 major facilitator superfamily domain-containing protein [Alternaria rosae]